MEDGKEIQEFIRTVRAVAQFYQMETLLSTMDWMLGAQGTGLIYPVTHNDHYDS